jgi:ABC-type histidine transport system ATPase subunit
MEQDKRILQITNLRKNFGDREILKGIDFSVDKGDVVCIIGLRAPASRR